MATKNGVSGAVVAVAGRRIDAPDTARPRFPLDRVPAVRQALRSQLIEVQAVAMVSSAACGADLIALEEAERLGLRRRIVLPFSPDRFRATSVVDRPGDWGPVFDRQIAAAAAANDLVVLGSGDGGDDVMYAAANEAIVREAQALFREAPGGQTDPLRAVAIIVWEGAPREGGDLTDAFRQLAARAGFEERVVLTQ
jgi:hypothetical protein